LILRRAVSPDEFQRLVRRRQAKNEPGVERGHARAACPTASQEPNRLLKEHSTITY